MRPDEPLTIAGAGLAGALLATLLAQRGWQVQVFEKRGDPRARGYEGGRSINLALAERGLAALRRAGLADEVLEQAVMMRGRMVHFDDGRQQLQRYGRDDSEVIWSVHRGRLNVTLLDAAERAGADIRFDAAIDDVDFAAREIAVTQAGERENRTFSLLIGADGAGSVVRQAMVRANVANERFAPLGHGYKELEIPPAPDGGFRIEPNALHIWPRGRYMCIALPNSEKSFTVTLFLPNEGEPSFASVPDADAARALFARDFPDALALMPSFDEDYTRNPVGVLGTLTVDCWHAGGAAVLVGDAAHAMVPFHGQGMNCAFEDCVALVEAIESSANWSAALPRYEAERRADAEAIQAMALENYLEMRDRVDDADYLVQRDLERLLAGRHPDRFMPRYAMVTFTRMPYAVAKQRGDIQRTLLAELTRDAARVEDVDLDRADRLVVERLMPL